MCKFIIEHARFIFTIFNKCSCKLAEEGLLRIKGVTWAGHLIRALNRIWIKKSQPLIRSGWFMLILGLLESTRSENIIISLHLWYINIVKIRERRNIITLYFLKLNFQKQLAVQCHHINIFVFYMLYTHRYECLGGW